MLWTIIVGLIIPLYLRLALEDPVDYSRGGLGAGDFKEYYIAARLIARGENVYDATLQAREMDALGLPRDDLGYRQTAYLYPSILAVMLMPLGGLPITDAARFWNLMNVVLLAIALFLLTEALDLRRSLGNHYPWIIILFAVSAPTTISLRLGQVNIFILSLLGLCLYAQRHRCSALAGFALGLATLFKVFPGGLLALLLYKKDYRTVIWGVTAMVLLLVGTASFLAITGRNAGIDWIYFTQILPGLNTPFVLDNQSVNGFFSRFELEPAIQRIAIVLSSVLIVLTTMSALARSERQDWYFDFSIVLTMFLLIFPITWWSTLILLLIPFATLLRVWASAGRPLLLIVGLASSYLLLNGNRILNMVSSLSNSSWLIALPFGGMLLLWGMMIGIAFYTRWGACEKFAK